MSFRVGERFCSLQVPFCIYANSVRFECSRTGCCFAQMNDAYIMTVIPKTHVKNCIILNMMSIFYLWMHSLNVFVRFSFVLLFLDTVCVWWEHL